MIYSTFVALLAFTLSATALRTVKIETGNAALGLTVCISAASNEDGEPLTIHNCTEDPTTQDWFFSPYDREDSGAQPMSIYGDMCVDVTDGIDADGTQLQIWTCVEGNTNQQWNSLTNNSIQWVGTDKCIDLTDGSLADGNVLQIWTCATRNTNQEWAIITNPEPLNMSGMITGSFTNSYCIGAASDTDGAEVAAVPCNSTFLNTFPNGNITWLFPVEPGLGVGALGNGTISTFSNKCLDVPNGSAENGVKLQIWTCTPGDTNQMFNFSSTHIQWNGKCVDLTNGNTTSGNPIQMWDCSPIDPLNPNQDWFPVDS